MQVQFRNDQICKCEQNGNYAKNDRWKQINGRAKSREHGVLINDKEWSELQRLESQIYVEYKLRKLGTD